MKNPTRFIFALLILFHRLIIAQIPVANFEAADTSICANIFVESFTDLSTNNPTGWKWYFPGATPDTSTIENPPYIMYDSGGFYNVTLVVKNNNGSDSITKTNYIHAYSEPHITITGNTSVCEGSVAIITAHGGDKYIWSTGQTTSSIELAPPASSILTVMVYNGPCFKDTSFFLIVDTMLTVRFKGDTSLCIGDSTTIYVYGYPEYGDTYLWNTGSTADSVFTGKITTDTTYYVTVTRESCPVVSAKITVYANNCTEGINTYSNPTEINISPNPASKLLSVILNNTINQSGMLTINDIMGRQIFNEIINPHQSQLTINVSTLSPAVYFLKIQTNQGMMVKKFVKE